MTAAWFAGVCNTRTNHGQASERRVCVLSNDVGHARVAGRVLLPGGVPSIRESLAAEQTTDKACLPADTRASLTRILAFLASKNLANLLQGKIIIIARNAASEFLLANFSQFCFLGQLLDGLCCR